VWRPIDTAPDEAYLLVCSNPAYIKTYSMAFRQSIEFYAVARGKLSRRSRKICSMEAMAATMI